MTTAAAARPQLRYLTEQLDELKAKGTYFQLRVLDDEQEAVCTYDGREVINLASNNYLGLCDASEAAGGGDCGDAEVWRGVGRGADDRGDDADPHGAGGEDCALQKCGGVRGVSVSGFAANAGTVGSILGKEDFILSDELNHASIIDGARLSRAKIKVFRHKDVAHAEELLKEVENEPGKQAGDHRWVFSHGRRHWAGGQAGRGLRAVWRDHDGG